MKILVLLVIFTGSLFTAGFGDVGRNQIPRPCFVDQEFQDIFDEIIHTMVKSEDYCYTLIDEDKVSRECDDFKHAKEFKDVNLERSDRISCVCLIDHVRIRTTVTFMDIESTKVFSKGSSWLPNWMTWEKKTSSKVDADVVFSIRIPLQPNMPFLLDLFDFDIVRVDSLRLSDKNYFSLPSKVQSDIAEDLKTLVTSVVHKIMTNRIRRKVYKAALKVASKNSLCVNTEFVRSLKN